MTAFQLIYDWLLSDSPRVKREHFFDVYTAAQYLKINELVEQCWESFASHSNFSEEKAFDMYLEAKAKGDALIMRLMMNRIKKVFLPIVATKEFLHFTCDEVVSFFEMNTMAVHSETEILFAAMRWLFHDWEQRQDLMLKVLSEVRFVLIHPSLLMTLTAESTSYELNRIMKNPDVDKMVKSSLEYMLSQYVHRDGLQTYELQERFKLDDVDDRDWIVDPLFSAQGKSVHFWPVNYKSFMKYLAALRLRGMYYWEEMEYVDAPSFLQSGEVLNDNTKTLLKSVESLPHNTFKSENHKKVVE